MTVQRLIFLLLSGLFFISTLLWFHQEFNPEWREYQKEYFEEQAVKVEKELSSADTILEQEVLTRRLASLRRPVYEIKQILLQGEYSWKKQQNGDKVDRCMTCHMDEEKLTKSHNTKVFPFDLYGCTVCHGGNGRALSVEHAHEGMYSGRREMLQRVVAAEPMFEFWEELATLTPEESDPNQRIEMGDFRGYCITGDRMNYVGSKKCLKCHTGLTSPHVERWQRIKFKTFERVKEAPDYIAGNEKYKKLCWECHTTGYNEETGTYSEEGVTCEACHGPGEVFSYFMDVGKAPEGQKIAKVGTFGTPYNICGPCHHTRGHEMRLRFFQEQGADEEWFFPRHTEPYKTISGETDSVDSSLPKIQ
ncbi:MAG: cytochrome c family protein [Candidatus Brocadiaceae bacterium]|nr:cytochrome c family protein [Candidatus Brocadiaceae bacterium]